MKITFSTLYLLVLGGCAASSGVIPIGNETYSVMHRDNGPMASLGSLKAEAYKDAAAFCSGKNRQVEVLRSNDIPRAFGQFPETEVQFTCIDKRS